MDKKRLHKKKKIRLRVDVVAKLLVFVILSVSIVTYVLNLKVKNIYITGTTNTKDVAIIEASGIKDYPKIYSLNVKKIKESVKTLPLVEDVKIKRNIFGKITFEVTEEKILFFYKYNNKYITNKGNSVDDSKDFYGYPTLINFTPDTIFEAFVNGLNKVDYNIIKMINEIEYTPYKTAEGTVIDNNHFTLKMNDTNTVMIDTVNMKNLNKYTTIIASSDMDKTRGVIYLDTVSEDRIYFKSYETIAQEEEEAKQKEENPDEQEPENKPTE